MNKGKIAKNRFSLRFICFVLFAACFVPAEMLIMPAFAQKSHKSKSRSKKKTHSSRTVSRKRKSKKAAPVAVDTAKKLAVADTSNTGAWGAVPDSAVTDGAYVARDFLNNRPTPYPNVREADVTYRKRVWREIDVRQKSNKFLVYPKSALFDILVDHIKAGELTAYRVTESGSKSDGDDFKKPFKTLPEFNDIFGGGTEVIKVADMNNPGVMRDSIAQKTFSADSNLVSFRVKEDWIFDKQRSIFEPRIIGIAPVIITRNTNGDSIGKKAIFWVYYPEARNVLAHAQVFNRKNDATNLSYDDIFIKRMFTSYVIKVSNAEDLPLKLYPGVKTEMDALIRGEKTKNDLMNYESDLWEY